MKTENIGRLISALGNPAHQTYSAKARVENEKQAPLPGGDAVKIAPSITQKSGDSEPGARQAKMDRIAAQIESGSYNPKSEEIAVALIKELNIG